MNLVDSCGWLEYFTDGPNAGFFAKPLVETKRLIVPSICLAEVYKRIIEQRNENDALQAIAVMKQGMVVELDAGIAVLAGKASHELSLPLVDSIILATAVQHGAVIWTQDGHFRAIAGVHYIPAKGRRQ